MKRIFHPAAAGLLLLALAFGYSVIRINTRLTHASATSDKRAVIRLAHYLVYESHREFFRRVVADYERLHPDVRVEVIDVPPQVWPTWRQTRFIGGNPPDLIQLGRGLGDEQASLYLRPLTTDVESVNPYNIDTPLAATPWRATFVDGLTGGDSYYPRLLEIYGVPSYLNLVRIFYNRDLFRRVLGSDRPPADYAEFISFCERIAAHARENDPGLVPLAGSIEYSRTALNQLMLAGTQRLARSIDLERDLSNTSRETVVAWLRGEWSMETAPVRDVWRQFQTLARHYQPGFLQASRDDAGFIFKQARSAMIVSGTWDANYFLLDSSFSVGAFALPNPDAHDSAFGTGRIGPVSEAAGNPSGAFGITKASAHPERALDFLRYLSSQKVNQDFARSCLRVPVVIGAKAPDGEAFAARLEGYEPGANPILPDYGSRSTQRLIEASLSYLLAPDGGDSFYHRLAAELPRYLREDITRAHAQGQRNLGPADASSLALALLPDTPAATLALARENRLLQEAETYQLAYALAEGVNSK